MKRHLLIIILLTLGCSTAERNDFTETKDLGKTTKGNIIYKLYQTGDKIYRYEFYLTGQSDTTTLFQGYLKDVPYQSVRFLLQESEDTIKLKSNRELGQQLKVLDHRTFILTRKIDPVEGYGFTVHGSSGQMTQLMFYNDSISSLTELETSVHRKIWELSEVDKTAKDLESREIKTFTIIEGYPNDSVKYFTVRFGQILDEDLPTISFYRVDSKSGEIEKMPSTGAGQNKNRLGQWHYRQQSA